MTGTTARGASIAERLSLAVFVLTVPAVTAAQDPPSPAVVLTYEVSRDRFHYRFENPSTFDTAELVPHEFTQTYWGDNQWVVVRARYQEIRKSGNQEIRKSGDQGNRETGKSGCPDGCAGYLFVASTEEAKTPRQP